MRIENACGREKKLIHGTLSPKSLLAIITIALASFAPALLNIATIDSAVPLAYSQPWAEPISAWMNVTGGSGSPNWIFRVGYPPSPFTINIEVSGVTDLFVWELKLRWNSSLLDFVSVNEGDFLSNEGPTAFYLDMFQDQVGFDYILANCTLLSGAGKSGSGLIATVNFDLDASATAGSTSLDLYETGMRDSSQALMVHGVVDGFVLVGDHELYPLLYLAPQTSVADPGETFDVTVWIADVMDLYGWGFELKWARRLLEATNIVNHIFLEGTNTGPIQTIDNLSGLARASVNLAGEQPGTTGSGPLATITFTVVATGESNLDLISLGLIGIFYDPPGNSQLYPIDHATFDGFFQSTVGQPHAHFTYSPLQPRENDAITFDASSSSDADGNIVTYFWDFDDGTIWSAVNPITTYVYNSSGTYVVSLTVTDNDGLEDTYQDLLIVEPLQPQPSPPVAVFHYSPPWPLANQTVTFDASYSYDPDGFVVSYAWDFGDGTQYGGFDPVTTHVYPELGTYLITLTVMDNDGLNGSALKYLTTVPPAAEVYVYPSLVRTSPDDMFTIDIRIKGVRNLFGWQVELSWLASVLDLVNVTEGDFLKGIEENPTLFLYKTYEDEIDNDSVMIMCTRLGYVSGVDGSGTLASITFRTMEEGETVLDLFDTILVDSRPTPYPIEHTSTDGRVISESPTHDVAITFAEAYPTRTTPGNIVRINALVANQGTALETFNVTAYYDDQIIEIITVWLPPGNATRWLEFRWDTTGVAEGTYSIRLEADQVPEETDIADNTYIDGAVTVVVPKITTDPQTGPVGTKITVNGYGLPTYAGLYLTFDDQLMGLIYTNGTGELTAVFNAPLSEAGQHVVKVTGYYYMYPMILEAPFTVIDVTPLDVVIDVGTIYFKGETARFHIQTVLRGTAVDVTSLAIQLRKPDGATETLTSNKIGTGFYRAEYKIEGKGSMTGTYTLVVEAYYSTDTVSASGASIKTFLVKPTWERELPKMAALSITSIGLIGGMLVLWKREKKRYS